MKKALVSVMMFSQMAALTPFAAGAEPTSRKCDMFAIGDSESKILSDLSAKKIRANRRQPSSEEQSPRVKEIIFFGIEIDPPNYIIIPYIIHTYGVDEEKKIVSISCFLALKGL